MISIALCIYEKRLMNYTWSVYYQCKCP